MLLYSIRIKFIGKMKGKISSAEVMNIFFFCILGFGLAFLSSNFFLGTEENMLALKETIVKSFTIRFFIWYLLGVVFVLLITTVNRILIRTGVLPGFNYKRLMKVGLGIMFIMIFIGTYLFFA